MKRWIAVLLVASMLASAAHAEIVGNEAVYVGGTLPNAQAGAAGRLDLTGATELVYEAGGQRHAIPYAEIQSFEYSRKLARRIGVVATIVVVAVAKRRQRKHFFTISYKDDKGMPQVVIFEVAKTMPQILLPILQQRSPRCSSSPHAARRC